MRTWVLSAIALGLAACTAGVGLHAGGLIAAPPPPPVAREATVHANAEVWGGEARAIEQPHTRSGRDHDEERTVRCATCPDDRSARQR